MQERERVRKCRTRQAVEAPGAGARAKLTVQAVDDAFVRIWRRDAWAKLTTRAVS
jgi:hypothetical protein